MSTHPSYRHAETYIAERHRNGEWVEVMRFSNSSNAREYVRNNTPAFSPWRIVRLRMTTRSEVLEAQDIDAEAIADVLAAPVKTETDAEEATDE